MHQLSNRFNGLSSETKTNSNSKVCPQFIATRASKYPNDNSKELDTIPIERYALKNACEFCHQNFADVTNHLKNTNTKCAKLYKSKLYRKNKNSLSSQAIIGVNKAKTQQGPSKHGCESIEHFNKEVIKSIFETTQNDFVGFFCRLFELMYFNQNCQQNMNWCICYPYNERAAVVFDEKNKLKRESTLLTINEKIVNFASKLAVVVDTIIPESPCLCQFDSDSATMLGHPHVCNSTQKCRKWVSFLGQIIRYDVPCAFSEYILTSHDHIGLEIYTAIHHMAYDKRQLAMSYWASLRYKPDGNELKIKLNGDHPPHKCWANQGFEIISDPIIANQTLNTICGKSETIAPTCIEIEYILPVNTTFCSYNDVHDT
jgi:hypothetical protein